MNILRKYIHSITQSVEKTKRILGINERNFHYIYPHNPRRYFLLADDKLRTKEILKESGVPTPKTYQSYRYFFELQNLEKDLAPYDDFVIKPSRGAGGNGIIVVTSRKEQEWIGPGGKAYRPPLF